MRAWHVHAAMLAAVVVAVTAGCIGSGGDKAGGDSEKPVVLTLESEDDVQLSGAPEFAAAVERLSGGTMRIELVKAGRPDEIDFERGVVEDVRHGKAQLGIVGVRVWDTLGVRSFQALVAPFLIDSYELEQRVLESPLAARMLEGVEHAGVVGVALLPGPLRRPFALQRAFAGPQDYLAAEVGIRLGGVAEAAFRALGATATGYVPGSLAGLDGAELDLTTIAYNDYDRGAITVNVVLWPKPYSIFMAPGAFASLTPEQREILRRAGHEARAPELRQIQRDEAAALSELCRLKQMSFVTASDSDVAALREAVQPVHDELERDPHTKALIAEIRELQDGASAVAGATPVCSATRGRDRQAGATALDGLWETTWVREELVAAGLPLKDAEAFQGHHTAEFADGRFRFQGDPGDSKVSTGAYTVEGDVVRLVFESGIGLQLGRTYELGWNVYRDTLTFSAVPNSEPLSAFLTAPYTRVR